MKHILIVDDDKFNLVIAYDTLMGHYLVSVSNSVLFTGTEVEIAEQIAQRVKESFDLLNKYECLTLTYESDRVI